MLKEDDDRVHVRANWPSRVPYTQEPIAMVRKNPDILQTDNPKHAPVSFDVLFVENCGRRFAGRKTFIEDLERIVPEAYEMVGKNLRTWQKSPPKVQPSETSSRTDEYRNGETPGPQDMPPSADTKTECSEQDTDSEKTTVTEQSPEVTDQEDM